MEPHHPQAWLSLALTTLHTGVSRRCVEQLSRARKLLECAAAVCKSYGTVGGEGTALLGLSECQLQLACLVSCRLPPPPSPSFDISGPSQWTKQSNYLCAGV